MAFKGKIVVDRSSTPATLVVDMGHRPQATGIIDETNATVQTGYFDHPDDRKYNFWYYTTEAVIYFDGDKGETSNFWTGELAKPTEDGGLFQYIL